MSETAKENDTPLGIDANMILRTVQHDMSTKEDKPHGVAYGETVAAAVRLTIEAVVQQLEESGIEIPTLKNEGEK